MASERVLAAVLFIDVVGSTEHASRVGDAEWRRLAGSFRDRVRRAIRQQGGREILFAGDGILATFDDPARAVLCADQARAAVGELGLAVRCGVHMGEVDRSARQIGGLTVHIGSRIMAEARAGEILVSGTVRDAEVGSGFGFEERGARTLRGVPGEWRLYAVTGVPQERAPVRHWPRFARRWALPASLGVLVISIGLFALGGHPRRAATDADLASIAVLPFENIGADPADEFFAEGMTDDIRTHLSRLASVKVIARSSAMVFRETKKSPAEIGRDLGVATLLEGSVRRSGDRVRIVAELVEARSGRQLWAATYDRELADVFAIQSDVAERIALAMQATLSTGEIERLRSKPTENLAAYTLYLKGRYFWNTRTREGLERAIDYFQQAISADPRYARAYAGLADAYDLMGQWYVPPEEAFPKAKEAALKALAIDSTLAEPRVALGYIAMENEWDWPAAERWLESAVRLDPGYSSGHQYYGNYLRIMGRFDEAIAEGRAALAIDPLSVPQQAELGYTYYYARRYSEALDQIRHTLEMDSTYAHAHLRAGQVLEQLGRPTEAVRELRRAVELSPEELGLRAALAHALALAGARAEAGAIVGDLVRESERGYVSPYGIAVAYIPLGDHDAAFRWLDRAYADRSPSMVSLKVHPWLDPLRDDPRFAQLLARLQLL